MKIQTRIKSLIVLTGLFGLVCNASIGFAKTGVCGGFGVSEIQDTMYRLTGRLKIANYRGHIDKMTEAALALHYWIDLCSDKVPTTNRFSCIPVSDQSGSNPVVDTREFDDKIGKICDYECHVELSRYHIFMSGDFIYASDAIHTDIERLQNLMDLAKDHADLCGIPVVERAMRLLSGDGNKCVKVDDNNKGVQDDCDGDTEGAQTSFEEMIRKSAALNALRIRLLLASGDLSYQASSDMALKKVMSIVEAALGKKAESQDNTIEMAYARYENALWGCIEALTDIPNMVRFDDIRRLIGALREESKKRLQSIQNGMLFLNIDPDFYVNISANQYKGMLDELKTRIIQIEDKISALQVAGIQVYGEEEEQGLTEARAISNLEVSLNAEKIGRLHAQLADEQLDFEEDLLSIDQERNEIDKLIEDENLEVALTNEKIDEIRGSILGMEEEVAVLELDKLTQEGDIHEAQNLITELEKNRTINLFQRDTLEYKKRIRQMQLDLDQRKIEMKHQFQLINSMEERDLLGLQRQTLKETQAKYQWLINHEITKMNLDLNLRSMATQILDNTKTIEQSKRAVESLHNNGRVKHMEYNIYESELKNLELQVKASFFSRYTQHVYHRLSARSQICAIESQLRYLGVTPDASTDYQLGQDNDGFFYATYRPFGLEGYGTYQFPTQPIISEDDRASFTGERTPEPIDDGFEYILFRSEGYRQQCIDGHDHLFAEAELTEDDVTNLYASDYRFVGNFAVKESNPIEDLILADGMLDEAITGDESITPAILLERSNNPCGELGWEEVPLSADDYQKALCEQTINEDGMIVDGIQKMIIDNQIDYNEFAKTCLYQAETLTQDQIGMCEEKLGKGVLQGTDPSGQPITKTYYQLTVELHQRNKTALQAKVEGLEKEMKRLKDLRAWLKPALETYWHLRLGLETAVVLTGAIANKMSFVPDQFVGMMGGVIIKPSSAAFKTFKIAHNLSQWALGQAKSRIELTEKMDQLDNSIAELEDVWNQIDKERLVSELSDQLTLVNLSGNYESLQSERERLYWEKERINIDCQKGRSDWIGQVNGLLVEHQRLVTELVGQSAGITQIDNQIQQYKIQADKALYQQEIVRAEIDEMNHQINGQRDDSVTVARIIENKVQQMCLTDNMRGRVSELEEELDGVEDALAVIDEAIEANLINTNQIERDKLASILEQAQYSTQELVNLNEETVNLLEANLSDSLGIWSLQSRINGLQQQMNEINQKIQASEIASIEQKQQIQALTEKINQSNTKIHTLAKDDVELRGEAIEDKIELTELQKGYHTQILALRNEIVDNITEVISDTEGKREQIYFNTQQAIASVNMGIVEYITAKKKLLDRANYYLNGMRARIKRLYQLNSAAGDVDTSLGYLKTANQLGEQIDYYTDKIWELAGIPAILGNNTTVVLPNDSGMVQELLLMKKVRFEVAPIPADMQSEVREAMEASGYYTIWNKNFEVPNARLVDVAMSGNFSCEGLNTVFVGVRHLGSGYVFLPINRTSDQYGAHMVVSNAVINPSAMLWEELDDSAYSAWNQFSPAWQILGTNTDLLTFERDLKERMASGAPVISGKFIGLPLAGVYEVLLHENANCPISGKDLSIHFKFTRDQNYQFEHID